LAVFELPDDSLKLLERFLKRDGFLGNHFLRHGCVSNREISTELGVRFNRFNPARQRPARQPCRYQLAYRITCLP
jgi:hypothetical protein